MCHEKFYKKIFTHLRFRSNEHLVICVNFTKTFFAVLVFMTSPMLLCVAQIYHNDVFMGMQYIHIRSQKLRNLTDRGGGLWQIPTDKWTSVNLRRSSTT